MIQHFPVLAIMLYFLGAFISVFVGHKKPLLRHTVVVTVAAVSFLLVCCLIKPVFIEGQVISYWLGNWTPVGDYAIGIGLEIDALGLFFGLLVSFTVLMSAIYSTRYMDCDEAQDKYNTLFLMLSGGVLGLVFTGDLFNMYIMVEIMTLGAVALTAFRGWQAGSYEASFKYLVIGGLGSSFILTGTIMVYAQVHTLNMAQISAALGQGLTPTTIFAFALLFAGYALKSFIFPFHPIAADAYTAAPTSVSMVFSGMVNKAGVYGLLRLCYVIFRTMGLPAIQTLLVLLGTVTMFVGVTMALSQHNLKRLLAFHSISQIGYVITAAGLATALGMAGGLYHAMNHMLFKGLLFLCAGAVAYAVGSNDLDKLGGLAKRMPQTTIIFLIGAFSISGLPPFNGFMSKWMIYQATYEKAIESGSIGYLFVTIVALVVSVMTLASFIKVSQSVFFGQLRPNCQQAKEVPLAMRIPMWIMAGLCVVTGVLPGLVMNKLITPAVNALGNAGNYINAMLGAGYAERYLGPTETFVAEYQLPGFWNPVLWLLLFVIILAAVAVVALTSRSQRNRMTEASAALVEPKFDTFYGGEKSQVDQVGGSDLFWGLRYNLRHYFQFIGNAHSGVVNDYALWAMTAIAVFIVYMIIFL